MEYTNFERDFIERTLKIVEQYEQMVMPNVALTEQFEATLLINCLIGLLVLPKERLYKKIPSDPIGNLSKDWGVEPSFIKNWGSGSNDSLSEFIHRLRNGVAHLQIKTVGDGREIVGLEFSDRNGFRAVLPVDRLKIFVTKLVQTVNP